MSDPVLTFTRPDGVPVHIVKSAIVDWSPEVGTKGTRINLINGGMQTVKEVPEQIMAAWTLIDG